MPKLPAWKAPAMPKISLPKIKLPKIKLWGVDGYGRTLALGDDGMVYAYDGNIVNIPPSMITRARAAAASPRPRPARKLKQSIPGQMMKRARSMVPKAPKGLKLFGDGYGNVIAVDGDGMAYSYNEDAYSGDLGMVPKAQLMQERARGEKIMRDRARAQDRASKIQAAQAKAQLMQKRAEGEKLMRAQARAQARAEQEAWTQKARATYAQPTQRMFGHRMSRFPAPDIAEDDSFGGFGKHKHHGGGRGYTPYPVVAPYYPIEPLYQEIEDDTELCAKCHQPKSRHKPTYGSGLFQHFFIPVVEASGFAGSNTVTQLKHHKPRIPGMRPHKKIWS
jgi:hypothetical protein